MSPDDVTFCFSYNLLMLFFTNTCFYSNAVLGRMTGELCPFKKKMNREC